MLCPQTLAQIEEEQKAERDAAAAKEAPKKLQSAGKVEPSAEEKARLKVCVSVLLTVAKCRRASASATQSSGKHLRACSDAAVREFRVPVGDYQPVPAWAVLNPPCCLCLCPSHVRLRRRLKRSWQGQQKRQRKND